MSQTRKQSFIEANINTIVGFMVSYFLLAILNYIYDMNLSFIDSLEITIIFTIASIGRNYFIRRLFNKRYSRERIT